MTTEQIAVYIVPLAMILGFIWQQAKNLRKGFDKKFDDTYERGEVARKATAKELEFKLAQETSTIARKMDDRHAETRQDLAEIKAQVTQTNGRVDTLEANDHSHDVAIARLQGKEDARAELAQAANALGNVMAHDPSKQGEHPQ